MLDVLFEESVVSEKDHSGGHVVGADDIKWQVRENKKENEGHTQSVSSSAFTSSALSRPVFWVI